MAEFVLGLTKTAVEGTLSRVKSAIEEEAELKVRVQNDLVFITGEFQMMQSFLNVANAERAKNEVVRTWVRQIRDLAFDVEDCVEFVVHLDNKSAWSWLWRVVPSCMAPPRPLDQAVVEIQQLKVRVEDVSQRNTRYNLISDSGSSSMPVSLVETTTATAGAAASFHILSEVWEAAGKWRSTGDLKTLITSEGTDLQVISLWGSGSSRTGGDLGMTSIIKKAYYDPKICQEFKSRAWVKLTHPFNRSEFLESLLTQFYASTSHRQAADHLKVATEGQDELIMQHLAEEDQRYLVVLEGLSTVVEWDVIRMYLPDSNNGSRIVVLTKQLGIALSCTGEPYQVSELRQFSDGQSLCAFFNKVPGRRTDMGELIWKLKCRGVISVWGAGDAKSTVVDEVYTGITHRWKEFDGVDQFERHNWVEVPDPFNLNVFSRRLFLNFHSANLRAKEIAAVGMMGDSGIIEECLKFLHEDDCLIVINGLQCTEDWDLIKATFLLSKAIKSCIVVVTKEANVARYCVDDGEDGALNIKDLEVDVVLRHLIKGCRYYGIGGKDASRRGRFFSNSNRRQEALDWSKRFSNVVPPVYTSYVLREDNTVISSLGTADVWKSVFMREYYYDQLLLACDEDDDILRREEDDILRREYNGENLDHMGFTAYSWVDVPHPFNLTDFSWRLLLDFYSDDLEAKEIAADVMMKGQVDPIKGCRELMRQHKYLVVIDGLQSTHDWDLIKDAILCEPINGTILVITDDETVATHCVDDQEHVMKVGDLEAPHSALGPLIMKDDGNGHNKQASHFPCNRREEACHWANILLIGHQLRAVVGLRGGLLVPGVTSMWGIAGVGKTALVKHVYYGLMLGLELYRFYEQKFTTFSWVDVSHPFNLTDFCWHLLLDFYSDDLQAKEVAALGMMEGQDPIQECRKFLRQEECFVVVDGLRSTDDWDLIRAAFLSESIKSCIVVITNEASVATYCVDDDHRVLNVKGLESDAALHLFIKIAWGGKQLSNDERKLSEVVMAKCGGLPSVIAAISQQSDRGMATKALLDHLNDDFMGTLEKDPGFHSLRGLFSWMQSYFDACPDSLKPCIFYLSVFPADRSIRRRRLLRRWIAEGYSRDKSAGGTAEEYGEKLFQELVNLSIIQPQSPENRVMFQVNGFFREYIISQPMEDNLVFALEGRCCPDSQRTGQHLTISSSWDRDGVVFESIDFSRLRSLTVFGKWAPFLISRSHMRLLRVLDLEDTFDLTDDDLDKIDKLPPRLKFLSLRGCTKISRLPSSLGLGGLRQLQTLDVRHTKIVTLPLAIRKLQKLQYIRAGTTVPSDDASDHVAFTTISIPTPPGEREEDATLSLVDDEVLEATTAPGGGEEEDDAAPSLDDVADPSLDDDDVPEAKSPPPPQAAITRPWRRRVSSSSWLSKKLLCRSGHTPNGGVEVAATWIGKLTDLRTLGVVNVNGAGGMAILKELKKLTQLRKLGVSGINRKNWKDLCSAISDHGHLESLSVRLDDDDDKDGGHSGFACFSDITEPPKNLKSLKVYGLGACIRPVWLKDLPKLQKVDIGITISTQEDIDILRECFEAVETILIHHLSIRPIEGGKLSFAWPEDFGSFIMIPLSVLPIDCSSRLEVEVTFGDRFILLVGVLKIHCSSGSALRISRLDNIQGLEEVRLMGSYGDDLKRDLLDQVSMHRNRPILKLAVQPSSC